ncbi:MAG TPA: nucleotidyltransferase domain-containing protein [Firmicutes bacterium]|nr:nucleotidyltransferase domain-containing protein [Bacillota bacterium]
MTVRDPQRVASLAEALRPVFAGRDDLVAVYLFGSYATPEETERSDVDLGVIFRSHPTLTDELGLEVAVCAALGTDRVDVVNLNRARVDFQFRALQEGALLFCADDEARADFVEEVLNRYGDYGLIIRRFHEDFLEGLREGRTSGRSAEDRR